MQDRPGKRDALTVTSIRAVRRGSHLEAGRVLHEVLRRGDGTVTDHDVRRVDERALRVVRCTHVDHDVRVSRVEVTLVDQLVHRARGEPDGGSLEENVLRPRHDALRVSVLPHRTTHVDRGIEGADGLEGSLDLLLAAPRDDDLVAVQREVLRGGLTDHASTTNHEDGLIAELVVIDPLLTLSDRDRHRERVAMGDHDVAQEAQTRHDAHHPEERLDIGTGGGPRRGVRAQDDDRRAVANSRPQRHVQDADLRHPRRRRHLTRGHHDDRRVGDDLAPVDLGLDAALRDPSGKHEVPDRDHRRDDQEHEVQDTDECVEPTRLILEAHAAVEPRRRKRQGATPVVLATHVHRELDRDLITRPVELVEVARPEGVAEVQAVRQHERSDQVEVDGDAVREVHRDQHGQQRDSEAVTTGTTDELAVGLLRHRTLQG